MVAMVCFLLEAKSTWTKSLGKVWLVEAKWSKRKMIQNRCPVVLLRFEEWKD